MNLAQLEYELFFLFDRFGAFTGPRTGASIGTGRGFIGAFSGKSSIGNFNGPKITAPTGAGVGSFTDPNTKRIGDDITY